MAHKTINRNAQERPLFSQEEMNGKSTQNGIHAKSMNMREYLHSRDGLWRILACVPQDMSVVEALELAPAIIFGRKGGEV